jgi:hypothetical protein
MAELGLAAWRTDKGTQLGPGSVDSLAMTEARIPITHSAMLESRRIINEHIHDPPSFIILLNEHDWTITPGRAQFAASKSLKHFSYADPAAVRLIST